MKRNLPRRRELTVNDYYQGVLARDIAVFPRALTLIESNHPHHQLLAEQLLAQLLPHTGGAIRVGISGAPGAGKSTFIETAGMHLVRHNHRVAVLAVDPTSRVSGGSILGDKTRMTRLSGETSAFIRPSPSAGTLGGVARKTRESLLVCEAAGFDVVLVETVGVGQSETIVADMTDCFLALMLPGAGDELQALKRGLLELVDVIAVNKADGDTRQAAELSARQLAGVLHSLSAHDKQLPPVLTCSALHDEHVDRVWAAVSQQHAERKANGQLLERRKKQGTRWLWAIVEDQLQQALYHHPAVAAIRDELEREVYSGTLVAEAAARQILTAFGQAAGGHTAVNVKEAT